MCNECFNLAAELHAIIQRLARADSGNKCRELITEIIAERKPAPCLHFGGYVSERLSKDIRPATANKPTGQQ